MLLNCLAINDVSVGLNAEKSKDLLLRLAGLSKLWHINPFCWRENRHTRAIDLLLHTSA